MGMGELIDFITDGRGIPRPPAVGWGLKDVPWLDCECKPCRTMQSLNRQELAFILSTLQEEQPDMLIRMLAAIEEVRKQLWP